jgi:hypothetical protein
MIIDSRLFILSLAMIITIGLTPAFATDPSTSCGTNAVTVCVPSTVAISVTSNANWDNPVVDDLFATHQSPVVASESNIPVSISVSAANWNTLSGVNMPLCTFVFANTNTPIRNNQKIAIDSLAAPVPGENIKIENLTLNMQVPIGSTNDTYNTTVIWTTTGV